MNLGQGDGDRGGGPAMRDGEAGAQRLPSHSISQLLIPTSLAVDLAEGRDAAHGQRVAFIAMSLANALGLEADQQLAACYAGLMHDIGVIAAGAGLAEHVHGDERLVFASLPVLSPDEIAAGVSDTPAIVVDRLIEHTIHGARAARELVLPQEAIKGIASHHENWNGTGYPHGLKGAEIPLIGRIVAVAEQAEAFIEEAGALQARRRFPVWLSSVTGTLLDPTIVAAMRDVAGRDEVWLGLNRVDISSELAILCGRLREPRGPRLLAFADSFSQIVDARFAFMLGVSAKVAKVAEAIGRVAGLSDLRVRQLRLAALFHDFGQLAISERVIAKPGIFTVEEHDSLKEHPMLSTAIVAGVPGLEEVAEWVAAHHERPDGKGYPEGRSGDEIPQESMILAVADTFVSITSDRPHRPRGDTAEAVRRLQAAAGTQFDASIVELFVTKVLS